MMTIEKKIVDIYSQHDSFECQVGFLLFQNQQHQHQFREKERSFHFVQKRQRKIAIRYQKTIKWQ